MDTTDRHVKGFVGVGMEFKTVLFLAFVLLVGALVVAWTGIAPPFVLTWTGYSPRYSEAGFQRIKIGDTLDTVEKLIGHPIMVGHAPGGFDYGYSGCYESTHWVRYYRSRRLFITNCPNCVVARKTSDFVRVP